MTVDQNDLTKFSLEGTCDVTTDVCLMKDMLYTSHAFTNSHVRGEATTKHPVVIAQAVSVCRYW